MSYEPPKLKLSELVAALANALVNYGDLDVYINDTEGDSELACYSQEQCWFVYEDKFILSNGSNLR